MTVLGHARRSALSVLTVGLLATSAVTALPATANAATTAASCISTLDPDYASYLSQAVDTAVDASAGVTIGFYDRNTDTTCFTDPQRRFKTASIVKVIIAVALELRAQEEGRALRQDERDLLEPMITESSNDAAIELWRQLRLEGPHVDRALEAVGMRNTVPGPGGSWGATITTAEDQINLLKLLTSPHEEFLELPRRNEILDLMSRVIPLQQYGVPVGAPPGTTWSNKIGYARLGSGWFDYRTHSIGAIRGAGFDYVMALLSDHNLPLVGIGRVTAAAVVLNKAKQLFPG